MSKNYELLQQADFALGSASEQTPAVKDSVREKADSVTSQTLTLLEPTIREEALKLVNRLFLDLRPTSPKAVLFAATELNSGCDWLTAVTAQVLAQSVPGSVCVVEGNLRSSSLSATFGRDPDRGLIDALQQESPIKEFAQRVGPENLWLLPTSTPVKDASLLLNSDRMKDRLHELRKAFDYIVMNAPSLGSFADAIVLGRLLDGVVLVLEANTTRREAAARAMESLRMAKIDVLGAVLNNRTFPIPAAVYKRV